MSALTATELAKLSAGYNLTNKNILTQEELSKLEAGPSSGWTKTGLAIEGGALETAAGVARLVDKLKLFDVFFDQSLPVPIYNPGKALSSSLGKESKKINAEFESTNPNIYESGARFVTNLGTTALIPGFGSEGALVKLLAKMGVNISPKILVRLLATPQGKSFIKRILIKGAKSIPGGIAFGAINANPEQSITSGAVIGGVLSPFGAAAGEILAPIFQYFTKYHQLLKIAKESSASTEQIKQAIKSAKGISPLAGKALNNPSVNYVENKLLPYLPGFEKIAREKLANMGQLLVEQSKDLFSRLTLDLSKQQRSTAITDLLDENKNNIEIENIKNYKIFNELANKLKAFVIPENFYDVTKSLMKRHSQTLNTFGVSGSKKALKTLQSILDTVKVLEDYTGPKSRIGTKEEEKYFNELTKDLPPDIRDILSKWNHERAFMGYHPTETAKKVEAEYLKTSPLDVANFTRSLLGDLAYTASVKGLRQSASIYNDLYKAITKDIDNAIERTNNKQLSKTYKFAQSFYKNNIVPLMDSKIWGAIKGKIDPDVIIKTFFPSGNKGRINLLSTLLKHAPGSEKIILTEVLSDALQKKGNSFEQVNPGYFHSLLGSIGEDRLSMLVKNPNDIQDINDFLDNMENASQVLDIMYNPKTGAVNLQNMISYENAKIVKETLENLMKGNHLGVISSMLTYATKLAEAKAVNDPEILQNIIKLREAKTVPQQWYLLGKIIKASGVPVARIVTALITTNQ
jgi:hypothetical protein